MEALRASRIEKREHLRRLRGGAQDDRPLRLARGGDAPPLRVDHHDRPEMDRLDDFAAAHLDQRGVAPRGGCLAMRRAGHPIDLPKIRHCTPNRRPPRLPGAAGVYYHARTPHDA